MAMIDYGAITWRDGRCVSTGMFDDMKKMVGWCDDGTSGYNEGRYSTCPLNGNYMSYIGDKYFTLAFYKNTICIYRKSNIDGEAPWVDTMYFGGYCQIKSNLLKIQTLETIGSCTSRKDN
jgi:hypothetical protein